MTQETDGRPVRRPWLTRNLAVLTAVSLMQDAAGELAYPLLPLFLTSVLGAPVVTVGLIEGLAEATSGLTQYVAGRTSDATARKPWIGLGYGLAAVAKAIVAAAWVWPVVLVGRVTDRFGKGVRNAPRDALIAESVPRESLGRAFGFHRAGDTVGAVIGPLLGLLALKVFAGDIRTALWVAVIPAVLAVGLVAFVREPPRAAREAARAARLRAAETTPEPARRRSPLSPRFWRVVVALTVIALVNFPDTLVLLRVSDLGWSASQVVFAYVVFNISYATLSYPAGALADRVGPPILYGLGMLCFATGYIGLGLTHGGWTVVLLLAVYGAFPALTDGVGKAWVSSLVTVDLRGRAMGLFQGLGSGSVLVAGLWAGLAWGAGRGDGTVPLVLSGVVGGVAGVALIVGRGKVSA